MYSKTEEDIVALATNPGRAALNVVRSSGPNVVRYLERLVKGSFVVKPNYCLLAELVCPATKKIIDNALVTVFLSPKSYTGQNVVEFSIHGGNVVAQKLISTLIMLGCRDALSGEFSFRAFINGKMDLVQAESVASIIDSNNIINVDYSLQNLKGRLSEALLKIKHLLVPVITYIEHELDFSEEEIDHLTIKEYKQKILKILKEVDKILLRSFLGKEIKSSITVCLAGKTNVGKSSLFNLLCGYDKAIVTREPGTTTDVLELQLRLNNSDVTVVDTAGIRKASRVVEKKGVKKSINNIRDADILLFVDTLSPKKAFAKQRLKTRAKKTLYIQNKIDINKKSMEKNVFHISCKKNIGVNRLLRQLSTIIKKHELDFNNSFSYMVSARGLGLLKDLKINLKTSLALLNSNQELAIVASSLHNGLEILNNISTPVNKTDILNSVFRGFCVGK